MNRTKIRKILSRVNESVSQGKVDINESYILTRGQIKQIVKKTVRALMEQKTKVRIKVEKPGVLEVPEGKKVNQLSFDHFLRLARKKGFNTIVRALTNIHVWNRKKNPSLSNWADKMQDRISKAREKSEAKR